MEKKSLVGMLVLLFFFNDPWYTVHIKNPNVVIFSLSML
jgi:hypothetical protein